MKEAIIKVDNLSFGYEKELVLEDVSFEIHKGDYMGIVGPNGAAKSTLLKLILGLLKPNKGTIELFGQDIKEFNQWSTIGYVSQRAREINPMFPATVEEVIGANLYHEMGFLKFLKKKHKQKVDEALRIVGMEDYKHRLIGNLSGGQQQRVFIARVLVSDPQVILMDEPLVGVDAQSQDMFYGLMEKLNKNLGITLIMISHDIGIITNKVTQVACMGDKKLYLHNDQCINKSSIIGKIYGKDMSIIEHRH